MMTMKLKTDTVFYRIGQCIPLPFILVGCWFAKSGYDKYHQLFECSFYRITGMPCPGCGGTRAFYYLFYGNLLKSFQYHPVVLFGILAWFHFMGLYFYRKHFAKGKLQKEIQVPVYFYFAIAVILIQWVVKILLILL